MRIEAGDILIRDFCEGDLPLMLKWLTDERVLEYYEDRATEAGTEGRAMERARELFLRYNGNRFYMDHDGVGYEYDGYHVPKETEEAWARECVLGFLESKVRGKEALRAYSAAAEFVGRDELGDFWESCLYYPLRAEHLDDVTILFMLPCTYRMAERAAKKRRLLRGTVDAYVRELDGYIRRIQERMAAGTLTRDADYDMNEFSDPVYVEDYLSELREKWAGI